MGATIEKYSFGSIQIEKKIYTKDLWIINGQIEKRDKGIAKRKFGTSHKISKEELKRVVTDKTRRVIIGAVDYGVVSMTARAGQFIEEKNLELIFNRTGELAKMKLEIGKVDSGIIHLTC